MRKDKTATKKQLSALKENGQLLSYHLNFKGIAPQKAKGQNGTEWEPKS